jgi:hypothetical protein
MAGFEVIMYGRFCPIPEDYFDWFREDGEGKTKRTMRWKAAFSPIIAAPSQ